MDEVCVPQEHAAEDLPWLFARQVVDERDGKFVTLQEDCKDCGLECIDCEGEWEEEVGGRRYRCLRFD